MNKTLFKLLIKSIDKPKFILGLFMSFIGTSLALYLPQFIGKLLDEHFLKMAINNPSILVVSAADGPGRPGAVRHHRQGRLDQLPNHPGRTTDGRRYPVQRCGRRQFAEKGRGATSRLYPRRSTDQYHVGVSGHAGGFPLPSGSAGSRPL